MAVRLPEVFNSNQSTPNPVPIQSNFGDAGRNWREVADIGNSITRDSLIFQQQLDENQAERALNQLREGELDLTHGDQGYLQYKGSQVLDNDIIHNYSQQHSDLVNDIESSLSNPQQRAMFRQRADASAISFKTGLMTYSADQVSQFDKETLNSTTELEARSAGANWGNPLAIDDSKARVDNAIGTYAAKYGIPEDMAKEMRFQAFSQLNRNVVSSALANRDFDGAEAYINQNKDMMDPSTLMSVGNELRKRKEDALLDEVQNGYGKAFEAAANPPSTSNLHNIVATIESGGKDYDANGKPITSKSGAMYKMGVLPSTANNPGFNIKPVKNQTPEEYNRLGENYLDTMVTRYNGDPLKAMAAYNQGPGAVDKAIAKGGDAWLSVLTSTGPDAILSPEKAQEVANYVSRGKKMLDSGEGYQPLPTEADVIKDVNERFGNADPDLKRRIQERALQALQIQKQAQAQNFSTGMQKVQGLVESGQLTDPDSIPLEVRQLLGPKLPEAKRYIEAADNRLAAASPVAAETYYNLRTNRDALMNMSPGQLLSLAPEIGRDRANDLVARRQDFIENPEKGLSADMDADQFKTIAKQFGYQTQHPSATTAAQLTAIRDATEQTILQQERAIGRKLTRDEKGKLISDMMTTVRTTEPNTSWWHTMLGFGSDTRTVDQPYYKTLNGNSKLTVPPADRAKIVAKLQAQKAQGAAPGQAPNSVRVSEQEIKAEYIKQQQALQRKPIP